MAESDLEVLLSYLEHMGSKPVTKQTQHIQHAQHIQHQPQNAISSPFRGGVCTILAGPPGPSRDTYFERLFGHRVASASDLFHCPLDAALRHAARASRQTKVVHATDVRTHELADSRLALARAAMALPRGGALVVSCNPSDRVLEPFEHSIRFHVVRCSYAGARAPIDEPYWTQLIDLAENPCPPEV